ncbi:hypothetical protein RND81_06G062500 [Saponaria officinalis]|uniref:PWWP domain-containing protein n=1 Tax=Saponaria officinalis TaxID=3572 RepID=A0AAW1K7X3_SAPOF
MKRKVLANGERPTEEKDSNGALVDHSNAGFRTGDVIWVKHRGSSWWPAQIAEEKAVSSRSKPRRKKDNEVLVRLYGSYEYSFVDPITSLMEFDNVLKRHKGNHKEIIQEALTQGFKTKARSSKNKGDDEKDVDDDKQGSGHGDNATPQKVGESARKLKVMQGLGLIPPSGSPYLRNGQTLTLVQ